MFNYTISFPKILENIVSIELLINNVELETYILKLPAWRPGRYQIQNFAKDIYRVSAQTLDGNELSIKKTDKDTWQIENPNKKDIKINYCYFANELNAGSSYVSKKLFYLNPINFCFYSDDYSPYTLRIKDVSNLKIATGQPFEIENQDFILKFKNNYELFDTPILISNAIETHHFEIEHIEFSFSIIGHNEIDILKILNEFKKFILYQIKLFGNFPEKNYHFLLLMVESAFYHGVEHRNSTMMVLGPPNSDQRLDLLGLASHELIHAWNVCKTRPKELCPYDYSKENYFETCFVVEGITTYLGDEILFKSKVISESEYNKELEARFKRHFENSDDASLSLLNSSFDLWLDGYQKQAPKRAVSVYIKGAIAAQALDILIRKKTKTKSIYDVMRLLYKNFPTPKEGYSYQDFKNIAEEIYEGNLDFFFKKYIESIEPIFEDFNELLKYENLEMKKNKNGLLSLIKTKNQ